MAIVMFALSLTDFLSDGNSICKNKQNAKMFDLDSEGQGQRGEKRYLCHCEMFDYI